MTDPPRIVEQEGLIVRIVAGNVEVIAEMRRGEDEIVFEPSQRGWGWTEFNWFG